MNQASIYAVKGESESRTVIFDIIEKSGVQIPAGNAKVINKMLNVIGCKVYLYITKPDKHTVFIEGSIKDAANGTVSFTLPYQATTAAGVADCTIMIVNGSFNLRIVGISLIIADNDIDDALESTDELTALTEALKDFSLIDGKHSPKMFLAAFFDHNTNSDGVNNNISLYASDDGLNFTRITDTIIEKQRDSAIFWDEEKKTFFIMTTVINGSELDVGVQARMYQSTDLKNWKQTDIKNIYNVDTNPLQDSSGEKCRRIVWSPRMWKFDGKIYMTGAVSYWVGEKGTSSYFTDTRERKFTPFICEFDPYSYTDGTVFNTVEWDLYGNGTIDTYDSHISSNLLYRDGYYYLFAKTEETNRRHPQIYRNTSLTSAAGWETVCERIPSLPYNNAESAYPVAVGDYVYVYSDLYGENDYGHQRYVCTRTKDFVHWSDMKELPNYAVDVLRSGSVMVVTDNSLQALVENLEGYSAIHTELFNTRNESHIIFNGSEEYVDKYAKVCTFGNFDKHYKSSNFIVRLSNLYSSQKFDVVANLNITRFETKYECQMYKIWGSGAYSLEDFVLVKETVDDETVYTLYYKISSSTTILSFSIINQQIYHALDGDKYIIHNHDIVDTISDDTVTMSAIDSQTMFRNDGIMNYNSVTSDISWNAKLYIMANRKVYTQSSGSVHIDTESTAQAWITAKLNDKTNTFTFSVNGTAQSVEFGDILCGYINTNKPTLCDIKFANFKFDNRCIEDYRISTVYRNFFGRDSGLERSDGTIHNGNEVLWGLDYDDLTSTGDYFIRGNSSFPTRNAPDGANTDNLFKVSVYRYTDLYIIQTAVSVRSAAAVYIRIMSNGTWNKWYKYSGVEVS